MKTRHSMAVAGACAACMGAASAQDAELRASVGLRAWYTQWTTFSYYDPDKLPPPEALTQVSANSKLVLVPVFGLRYGDWVGSLSVMPTTRYMLPGGPGSRREWDLNLGYSILPGLTATLGYKQMSQRDDRYRYEPKGPLLGLNANAQINGPLSMYGIFGFGKLKTPTKGNEFVVKFKADYHLAELGLAYALDIGRPSPRMTLTGGWRIQTMSSKEAFGSQDGRDTTQGLTMGVLATF
jgi:hypothetical protein